MRLELQYGQQIQKILIQSDNKYCMGDPFRRYSTISSFFFFHLLPMQHLKCCWACQSFADTLVPAPLRWALARGAPASSSLPPAPPPPLLALSCSLAPQGTEVAHPPLLGPFLPPPVAPPLLLLALQLALQMVPSPSLPLALLPAPSHRLHSRYFSFLANCSCCGAGHRLSGCCCCSCQQLLLLEKAAAADSAVNCCFYRWCCSCRGLLLLPRAATSADGCFSCRRLLLLWLLFQKKWLIFYLTCRQIRKRCTRCWGQTLPRSPSPTSRNECQTKRVLNDV